jgi:hypothetical protein
VDILLRHVIGLRGRRPRPPIVVLIMPLFGVDGNIGLRQYVRLLICFESCFSLFSCFLCYNWGVNDLWDWLDRRRRGDHRVVSYIELRHK